MIQRSYCLLLLLLLSFAPTLLAQDKAGEKLVLADGTELFVVIDAGGISEQGLSVKWLGAPLQIEWKMLDASAMKGLRSGIVDWKDAEQVRNYGLWCSNNGMDKEFASVDAKYKALTGKSISRASPLEVIPEPETKDPDPDAESDPGKSKVNEPAPKKEPAKVGGAYFPVHIDGKKAAEIAAELGRDLKESGLTISTSAKSGHATLRLKSGGLEIGENPKFFGASVYVEYKGLAVVEILDADGKSVSSKSFDTGLLRVYPKEIAHLRKQIKGARSLETDEKMFHDYCKEKARGQLVAQIASWARGYLPRQTSGG